MEDLINTVLEGIYDVIYSVMELVLDSFVGRLLYYAETGLCKIVGMLDQMFQVFAGITKVEAYSSDSSAAVQSQPVGAGKDGYCKNVYIGEGVVEDTGARVKGYHIDVWFPTHAEAQAWGSREMYVALPPAQ